MPTKKPLTQTIKVNARKMRKEPTGPEAKLWFFLRRKQLGGFRFRRQHPIEPYIVDFYCHQVRLVIELDGATHAYQETYDANRLNYLNSKGFHILRFWNNQVMTETEAVLELILAKCLELRLGNTPS